MNVDWKAGLLTGAMAGAAAMATAMAFGAKERGKPLEPMNCVSHMVLGDDVPVSQDFDPEQTSIGVAGHASAALSWGVLYEVAFGDVRWPASLLSGAAFSAAVWVVDYRLVPKRFTPGFEKALSQNALLGIYTALALGFAASPLLKSDGSA